MAGLYPYGQGITGNDVDGRNELAALDVPLREQFYEPPSVIRVLTANGYLGHQSGTRTNRRNTDAINDKTLSRKFRG